MPYIASDWSREEVDATVSDYFAMLAKELVGERFNKAEHNRRLERLLNRRSRTAIEFKHANISAILIDLGYPYVDGYKPRGNYQQLLREIVAERLAGDRALQAAAAKAVVEPVAAAPGIVDWTNVIVDAPRPAVDRSRTYERQSARAVPSPTVNFLEREARNASLGAAGEEFVLRLEHARLWQQGARRLANRVERVSVTRGDSVGYDILSFEANGRERMIEAKTTRYGAVTPFFASKNEVLVSEMTDGAYHLYRVFKFGEAPKVFILSGSLRRSVILDPMVFRASLRSGPD